MNLPPLKKATICLPKPPHLIMTAAMRSVLCDVKMGRLTKRPEINAPDAPTVENYENDDKLIP